MTEVVAQEAIDSLLAFRSELLTAKAAVESRPKLLRVFMSGPVKDLRTSLNGLVDYLSNSTDKMVINLLNKYPFDPTMRSLGEITSVTDKLLERFGYKGDDENQNNNSDTPNDNGQQDKA